MANVSQKIMGLVGVGAGLLLASTLSLSVARERQVEGSAEQARADVQRVAEVFSLLHRLVSAKDATLRLARLRDADLLEKQLEETKKLNDQIHSQFAACGEGCAASSQAYEKFLKVNEAVVAAILRGDIGAANEVISLELNAAFEEIVLALGKRNREITERISLDGEARLASAKRETLLLAALGVVTAGLLLLVSSWFASTRIIRPLRLITAAANRAAKGDFSQLPEFESGDEVAALARAFVAVAESEKRKSEAAAVVASGDLTHEVPMDSEFDALGLSLRKMVEELRGLVLNLQQISQEVRIGGGQIVDATGSLSQGAAKQAVALEEIAASMSSMRDRSHKASETVQRANAVSSNTRDLATQAKSQVEALVGAMELIRESGRHVSRILRSIDEIAFQTNLLALNAAVEAARAGKAGKGFAVVADEVRTLAGRSATAAKETEELVKASESAVEEGVSAVNAAAGIIGAIAASSADSSSELCGAVEEIAELAEGIGQVSLGLQQIEQVVHQNTATAEEVASVAREFGGLVHSLAEAISTFRT